MRLIITFLLCAALLVAQNPVGNAGIPFSALRNPDSLPADGLVGAWEFVGNPIKYPSEFDNAAWTKGRSSVTANAVVAPDGTQTADMLVEDGTASNTHYASIPLTNLTVGTAYVAAVYLKAGTRTWVAIDAYGSAGHQCFYDLSTGSVGTCFLAYGAISPAPNGFLRILHRFTADATTHTLYLTLAAANNTTSYNGDGTSGLYLWGASLTPAVPSTKNLLAMGSTEPLLAAIGTKSAGVTQASFTENGLQDGIQFPASGAQEYACYRPATLVAGTSYVLSAFVVMADASTPVVTGGAADFALVMEGVNPTVSVQQVAGSLYRVSATHISIGATDNWGVWRWTTNSGKAFRVTGFQLEASSVPTPYEPNPRLIWSAPYRTPVDPSRQVWPNVIAEQRRNWLGPLSDTTAWTAVNSASRTNGQTAPDGTATAVKVTHAAQNSVLVTRPALNAGMAYILSFWARRDSGTNALSMRHDPSSLGFGTVSPTSTWTFYSFTFTATSSSAGDLNICQDRNASGFGDVTLWHVQLESGSTPTPYQNPDTLLPLTLGSSAGADSNDPAINSASITFDGVDDYVTGSNGLIPTGASQKTVIVVANPTLSGGYFLSGGAPSTNSLFNFGLDANLHLLFSGYSNDFSSTLTTSLGSWAVYGARYRGGTAFDFTLNGAIESRTLVNPLSTGSSGFALGKYYAGTGYYNGSIAYVLIYNRALSDAEIATTYQVLKSRLAVWGVQLP